MKIKTIHPNEIIHIQNLWEKLNKIHLNDSKNFKDHFENFTFKDRCQDLISKDISTIRIDVLYDTTKPVGYCISTITKKCGEIESLFVEESYRKLGYGKELVNNSINWLESNDCEKIEVSVAAGHESVLGFYEKFDFYPKMISLRRKKTNT